MEVIEMRFKATNLLMGALIICLVATLAFAERPAGRQVPSGALSGRLSSPSFSGMDKGQPVGSGFRSTPRQERLSPSIWGNTSSEPSRAGSFGSMRGELIRTRADKPQIPQGSLSGERKSPSSWNNENTNPPTLELRRISEADKSYSAFAKATADLRNVPVGRTRDSSRVINRDDNRHRSDSFDFGFSHRNRDNVSVAVSSSHRDNDRHYRSYNYPAVASALAESARDRSHYGYNGYWYRPWSGLSVTYYSDGLGVYVNTGYPVRYNRVWVPGYWETYYMTEEFLNSCGEICYRYVPYSIWVSGYWSTSY